MTVRSRPDVPLARASAALAFEVSVEYRTGYRVLYGPGLLDCFGEALASAVGLTSIFVCADARVQELYGERLERSLDAAGLSHRTVLVPRGERSKSLEQHAALLHELAGLGCQRHSVLVSFGGGVVSDLTGFAAASYMRGIRYANLSTTLLGQVDASVGGKVAVNLPGAKNLVGAFHHPSLVVGDTELLGSLDGREVRAGIAEVIKVAVIGSPSLFALLEEEREAVLARDPEVLGRLVHEGARLKMEWVGSDPYERDLRRPLNLGHTLGHPIETSLAYQGILHGEAVAIGLGAAVELSRARGAIAAADADRILDLLAAYGLGGSEFAVDPPEVVSHVAAVRLIRGGHLHFVLPRRIGEVSIVEDVPDRELVAALAADRARVAQAIPR